MGGDAGHSRSKRRQLVSQQTQAGVPEWSQAHKGWRCEVAENGAATRDWNFAGSLAGALRLMVRPP